MDGLRARPFLAGDGFAAINDFVHPFFDHRQIRIGKRLVTGKIVIKSRGGHRPKRHLGIGEKLLHRLGHDMGGIMAQQSQSIGRFRGNNLDAGILVDSLA